MSKSTAEPTLEVRPLLEDPDPPIPELEALRVRALTEREVRKEIDKVLDDLPLSLELAGRAPSVIRTKGYALYVIGENRRAVEWLAKAGTRARVRHVLGRALLGSGRPEEAASILAEIKEREPEARVLWVEALLRSRDLPAARKALKELSSEEKEGADGLFLAGFLAELAGEYGEAYRGYRAALERDPEHAKAMFRLAFMLDLDGNEDEAVELYERLRGLRPTYTNALVNLGVLYEDRGEYSKAIDVYSQILKIYPNHRRARRFLRDAKASLNMYYDEDLERTEDRRAQILMIPISDFELSVRSRNCLAKMNIETLGDLIKKTEQELLSYKNFGETSLQEIKDILAQKGLRLGMGREERTSAIQRDARTLLGIEPEKGDILQKRIEDLELSVRSRNAMAALGVETLGDLTKFSEKDLMLVKNFGQTSMNEVKEKLAEYGLSLADPR